LLPSAPLASLPSAEQASTLLAFSPRRFTIDKRSKRRRKCSAGQFVFRPIHSIFPYTLDPGTIGELVTSHGSRVLHARRSSEQTGNGGRGTKPDGAEAPGASICRSR